MFLSIGETLQGLIDNFSFARFLQVTLVLAGGAFVLGIILRAILGKGSKLNKSIGAVFGILMIYIVSVAINIENHYEIFMQKQPFVADRGKHPLEVIEEMRKALKFVRAAQRLFVNFVFLKNHHEGVDVHADVKDGKLHHRHEQHQQTKDQVFLLFLVHRFCFHF